MDETKKESAEEVVIDDSIAKLKEENEKLIEERDNYKNVALKRLGKLPGDAEFLNKGEETELSVAEQVRLALLDKEIESNKRQQEQETARLIKENSELRLALKNRPGQGLGGGEGGGSEVKDNVFSAQQIDELTKKAKRLNADPEKFIENAKKNLLARH